MYLGYYFEESTLSTSEAVCPRNLTYRVSRRDSASGIPVGRGGEPPIG